MSQRARKLLLWCAATDATFARARQGDVEVLDGKCIHCNRKLAVDLQGRPLTHATVEHIVPRHHGGTDELHNLAVACARCNQEKGVRHDAQRRDDPKLVHVIETLLARRRARWREALPGLDLPALRRPDDDRSA